MHIFCHKNQVASRWGRCINALNVISNQKERLKSLQVLLRLWHNCICGWSRGLLSASLKQEHIWHYPLRGESSLFCFFFSFLAGNRCLLLNLEEKLSSTISSRHDTSECVKVNSQSEWSFLKEPTSSKEDASISQWLVVEIWASADLVEFMTKSVLSYPLWNSLVPVSLPFCIYCT